MRTFIAKDGRVYRNGVFVSSFEYAPQIAAFERSATAGDWWSPYARGLARELREAIDQAEESEDVH